MTVVPDRETILDYLDRADIAREAEYDVLKVAPDLTIDQAYALQFGLMERRAARGDRCIGYQASFTSVAMKRQFPDMIAPYYGSLPASTLAAGGGRFSMTADVAYSIEAEIVILMRSDLAGPDVTPADLHRSVGGVLASVEIASTRPRNAEGKIACSQHHMIATHNTDSRILLGSIMRPLDFELRLEGVAVSVDGVPFGSGTGVEALGSPLNVVAGMANWLGQHGRSLRAGDILLTGAVAPAPRIASPACVTVEFASLGSFSFRLE